VEWSRGYLTLITGRKIRLDELRGMIPATNTAIVIGSDGMITDALACRDALRARHSIVTAAADAAAGKRQAGMGRQLRSELKMLAALSVAQLRAGRQPGPAVARAGRTDPAIQLGA
jgi:hypothetical protein